MATVNRQPGKVYSSYTLLYFPEGSNQSFKKGEFVYLDSNGYLVVCPSDSAKIAGMALADASGTQGTAIPIAVAEPGTRFVLNVYHSTAASAVTNKNQVGKKYGLYRDTSNYRHYVDLTDTSNTRLVVVDLYPGDNEGDQYGRLIVEVEDNYCQLSSTSS